MRNQKPNPKSKRKAWLIGLSVTVAIAGIVTFYWPRSPVELSDHGYDLTTALYRACNQRSVEGLSKIEQLMAESEPGLSDRSRDSLASIIAQAKSGDWKNASIACRQSLEDQVQR